MKRSNLSLVLLLVLTSVLVLPAPVIAQEGGYSFDFELLGLGVDLYGAHLLDDGKVLIAGDQGVLALGIRGPEGWRYELLSVGGPPLMDVLWTGRVGFAFGSDRAVLIELLKNAYSARDLTFLKGDFVVAHAVLSGDSPVVVVAERAGQLAVYMPGTGYATRVTGNFAALMFVRGLEGCLPILAVTRSVPEGDDLAASFRVEEVGFYATYYVALPDGRIVHHLQAGECFAQVKSLLKELLSYAVQLVPVEGIRGAAGRRVYDPFQLVSAARSLGFPKVASVMKGLAFVPVASRLAVLHEGQRFTMELAFPVSSISATGSSLIAVGAWGGIALIRVKEFKVVGSVPVLDADVEYISVPGSKRAYFLSSEEALVLSRFGIFVHRFSRGIEFMPTAGEPVALAFDGSSYYIVSAGVSPRNEPTGPGNQNRPSPQGGLGNLFGGGAVRAQYDSTLLYRLVGAGEWRVGLQLLNVLQGAVAVDAGRAGGNALVLAENGELYGLSGETLRRIGAFQVTRIVSGGPGGEALLIGSQPHLVYANGSVSRVLLQAQHQIIDGEWVRGGAILVAQSAVLTYSAGAVTVLEVRPERLLSVAVSSDRSYALVGGERVLLVVDGLSVQQVGQKHAVTYYDMTSRPERSEFLAVTSLGLMRIAEQSRPPQRVEVKHRTIPLGFSDGLYRVGVELNLKYSSLAPVCRVFSVEAVGPAVAQVLESTGSCPRTARVLVKMQPDSTATLVVRITSGDGESVSENDIPLKAPPPPGIFDSVGSFFGQLLPVLYVALPVALILPVIRVLRRRKKEVVPAPQEVEHPEPATLEAQETEQHPAPSDEEGYYDDKSDFFR